MRSLILCSLLSVSVLFAQEGNKAKADKKDHKKENDNFQVIIQQDGDKQEELNLNLKDLLNNQKGNKPLIIINGKEAENLDNINQFNLEDIQKLIPKNIDQLITDAMKRRFDNPNKRMLKRYDKNGNGKIDEAEKETATKEMDEQMKEVNKVFQQFGNGNFDLKDLPLIQDRAKRFKPGKKADTNKHPFEDEDDHFEGVL